MVTIQVDDETAAELRKQAASAGLELVDYLRQIVNRAATNPAADWRDLEQELDSLSCPGSEMHSRLSRADIYADHD